MKCPHCLEAFNERQEKQSFDLGSDINGTWSVIRCECPTCEKFIFFLKRHHQGETFASMVSPKGISRASLPPEVPDNFTEDYKEACLVLLDSPKASAALSRRCLQNILREEAKVKPGNLANEIQQVIDSKTLPPYLSDSIDVVRNVGLFAAHPIKSQSTGEIVSVEQGEAEWNLDVIEALFKFYFVEKEILRKKHEALNEKLKDAGKPPTKK